MSVVVGVVVALAVCLFGGPRGRSARALAERGPTEEPGRRHPTNAAVVARPGPGADLAAVLLATSAQLRAGAGPADAWGRSLGVRPAGPVPTEEALLAATTGSGSARGLRSRPPSAGSWRRGSRRLRPGDGDRQRARAVVAAARLSDELGAPLAGVLDRLASAVAADEEAEGERRAALAGPRATAQVLAWLPVLGLLLGGLLGADPVGVVLSGGLGTVAAVLGGALLLLGRWWTGALLRRAARP